MRKPRAVIYDDEKLVLNMLEDFLTTQCFEVLSFREPKSCPIYDNSVEKCEKKYACSDIIITDNRMPKMSGLELLKRQTERGCKVDVGNKVLISATLDATHMEEVQNIGCSFFIKPFKLSELAAWLNECQKRINLSVPVAIKRKEMRFSICKEIKYEIVSGRSNLKAYVVNFSDHGLCFRTDTPVFRDQTVIIQSELPNSCENATIRWVSKIEGELYLAGLSCCL